jgi:hypothetical protein
MTDITDAGRQLATDLANAEAKRANLSNIRALDNLDLYRAGSRYAGLTALARLATQSIARDAELAALHKSLEAAAWGERDAEKALAEAKADLREIDRIAIKNGWNILSCEKGYVAGRAARHRETDPLTEALREAFGAAAPEFVEATRVALSKRGYELAKVQP